MVLRERTNGKQDVGLALLGISSSYGIWSSFNTSPVGLISFGTDSSKVNVTYKGMNWGLAVILAMSAGIGLYYGKKGYAAAITTAASGIGMWLWYDRLIKEYSIDNPNTS
jgi:hypothetical protein